MPRAAEGQIIGGERPNRVGQPRPDVAVRSPRGCNQTPPESSCRPGRMLCPPPDRSDHGPPITRHRSPCAHSLCPATVWRSWSCRQRTGATGGVFMSLHLRQCAVIQIAHHQHPSAAQDDLILAVRFRERAHQYRRLLVFSAHERARSAVFVRIKCTRGVAGGQAFQDVSGSNICSPAPFGSSLKVQHSARSGL